MKYSKLPRRPVVKAISNQTNITNRKSSSEERDESFISSVNIKPKPSIKKVQLEIRVNNYLPLYDYVPTFLHSQSITFRLSPITSATSSSSSLSLSLPSPNTSNNKSINVQVYHNAKLQEKIDQCEAKLHVDLSYCNIIDRDMLIIVNRLILEKKCTELWLYGNQITPDGMSVLATSLINNPTLKSLDLAYNQISDRGVRSLTEALLPSQKSSLKILYLSKNRLSDDGAIYLSEMLRTNRTITELWISDNEIGDRGVKQLAKVLAYQNSTLKVLSLSKNTFITDSSLDSLVELFEHNEVLRKIWINDCSLTERVKMKLYEKAIRKNSIHVEL